MRIHQCVNTDAEVVALPTGTILRDAEGRAWYRGEGSWVGTGDGPAYAPECGWGLGVLPFPALVLWRGEAIKETR